MEMKRTMVRGVQMMAGLRGVTSGMEAMMATRRK
jgi:hypothetical protein